MRGMIETSKTMLLDTFPSDGTEEIEGISFMEPLEVVRHDLVRPGTREWVENVMRSGLPLDPSIEPLSLPDPQPFEGAVDLKMTEWATAP